MAGSVNKVIIVGNLGKDPEVRYLENGVSFARFPVATSETFTDKTSGEKREVTDWHNIVVWRGLAKIAESYLKKGMKVYIEGKLKTRSWQDENQQTKYTTEIVGDQLIMLSKAEQSNEPHKEYPPTIEQKQIPPIDPGLMSDPGDGLPFLRINHIEEMYKLILFFTLFGFIACSSEDEDYYPKPGGYMRVDYPERVYTRYDGGCSYSFEIPDYFSIVDKDSFCNKKDIVMSRFNAILFLTYIPVDTNLNLLIEKSRQFAYEHSQFADAIEETAMIDPTRNAYGLRYNIVGNAASPYQFYLTDSVNHFLRGSFSFNVAPNYDSIKPSLDYIVEDLDRMIETVIWKNDSIH